MILAILERTSDAALLALGLLACRYAVQSLRTGWWA